MAAVIVASVISAGESAFSTSCALLAWLWLSGSPGGIGIGCAGRSAGFHAGAGAGPLQRVVVQRACPAAGAPGPGRGGGERL